MDDLLNQQPPARMVAGALAHLARHMETGCPRSAHLAAMLLERVANDHEADDHLRRHAQARGAPTTRRYSIAQPRCPIASKCSKNATAGGWLTIRPMSHWSAEGVNYPLLADAVLLFHLAFILFVVFGALLVWRFPRLVWLHLPAAVWGAAIEISGRVCPLTPLENHLRRMNGETGYRGGFIEHYLLSVIYPHALTREMQIAMGIGVVLINAAAYALLMRRRNRLPSDPR
ncbi:MAG: DUF2784 domain-containing protein [Candidatus Nitricoxidivorans perseverans]|uniref:DUF2784 domain-containing protein n=1 Tax=Candidatus Nitricoxidivorans perseverans TaxID=2975601 RepID=A0AA49FM28_9PROT|nr:MAG: DUF2784 domain-containing protein [Candidatus Nitricoxidivorans perseverans]